jgi:hypothetical protein
MKQRIIIRNDDELVTMPLEELFEDLRDEFIHVLDELEERFVEYFRKHGLPPVDSNSSGYEDWFANAWNPLESWKMKAIGGFQDEIEKWMKGELDWQK